MQKQMKTNAKIQVRILKSLHHLNVIEIYQLFQDEPWKYYVSMDADTVYDELALSKIIDRVSSAENVVAATGNIRIVNNCKVDNGIIKNILFPNRILLGMQVIQYLRNIVFKRTGLSFLGSELIIAGAFGVYQRDIVLACGAYLPNCVGEDMELTIRVHRYCIEQNIKYNIILVADAVAWTESPENISDVITQGERWHRGMIDSLSRHRDMLLNPRYGKIAFIGLPYYFFTQLVAPILELSAWFVFAIGLYYGVISWTVFAFFLIVTSGTATLLSMASLLFNKLIFNCYTSKEIIFKALPCSIIENFGFRQLIILSQLLSFVHYFKGNRSWKFTDSRKLSTAVNKVQD